MTTGGEGGMVTTNDEDLWRFMWSYKDHGKSYAAVYEKSHPPGFRWLHESFGTNWRMLEMQAVIGRIQLLRLPEWTEARRRNAEAIWEVCCRYSAIHVPRFDDANVHAHYKCYVYVDSSRLKDGWSRDRIIEEISKNGVPCMQGSCSEVYKELAFDNTGWRPAEPLPVAKNLGETSVMFLVHPTLTNVEMDRTCTVIDRVLAEASNDS